MCSVVTGTDSESVLEQSLSCHQPKCGIVRVLLFIYMCITLHGTQCTTPIKCCAVEFRALWLCSGCTVVAVQVCNGCSVVNVRVVDVQWLFPQIAVTRHPNTCSAPPVQGQPLRFSIIIVIHRYLIICCHPHNFDFLIFTLSSEH